MNEPYEIIAEGPDLPYEVIAEGPDQPQTTSYLDAILSGKEITSQPKSFVDALGDTVGQGLGSFVDEAAAGITALRPDVSYDQALSYYRPYYKQLEANEPAASIASNIAGSVATASLTPVKALQGMSPLMRILSSTGLGALAGGVQGFGAGEGDALARVKGAEKPAVVGALLGGGTSAGVESLIGALKAGPIQRTVSRIIQNEIGAIGEGASKVKGYSKEVIAMLGNLAGLEPEKLEQSIARGQADLAAGIPITPVEALAESRVGPTQLATAKYYGWSSGGEDIARPILKARAAAQKARIANTLGIEAEEISKYDAGEALKQAAEAQVKAAEAARTKAVSKLYQEAEKSIGTIEDSRLDNLIEKSANVKAAVKQAHAVKESYADLPDSNFKILQSAKKIMDGWERDAKLPLGHGRSAVLDEIQGLREDRQKLLTLMDENDASGAFAKGRAEYQRLTKESKVLDDGIMHFAASLKQDHYTSAIKKVLSLPKKQFAAFFDAMGPDSEGLFKSMVKSHFADIAASTKKNVNFLNSDIFTPKFAPNLKKIFGEADYARIEKALNKEELLRATEQEFQKNSGTAPLIAKGKEQSELAKDAARLVLKPQRTIIKKIIETIGKISEVPENKGFNTRMAELYWTPAGFDVLQNEVLPLALQRQAYMESLGKLAAGGRLSPTIAGLLSGE